jgi:hydroxymethylbilane synthase
MPLLRIGTRTSRLARWQAEHVADALRARWPGLEVDFVEFVTEGDRQLAQPLPEIGGKGVFTEALEQALRAGEIDLAVHSLKDLPTADAPGLAVGAIPEREDPRDAWVSASGLGLDALPEGAVVGTSSLRRASQLLRRRPDLDIRSIRGNVETRLRKTEEGGYDATVLACAGLLRLGLMDRTAGVLDLETMLPAPGQAALGIQVRGDDPEVGGYVAALDHAETRAAVEAERHFLAALGGGCSAPVAALAERRGDRLHLRGRVAAADGSASLDVALDVSAETPEAARALGEAAAEEALRQGARALLP